MAPSATAGAADILATYAVMVAASRIGHHHHYRHWHQCSSRPRPPPESHTPSLRHHGPTNHNNDHHDGHRRRRPRPHLHRPAGPILSCRPPPPPRGGHVLCRPSRHVDPCPSTSECESDSELLPKRACEPTSQKPRFTRSDICSTFLAARVSRARMSDFLATLLGALSGRASCEYWSCTQRLILSTTLWSTRLK
jgi:hypothetical protein